MQAAHANKWFVDYNSLDIDQKRLVNGGVFSNGQKIGLINGPAGSGKTIILVNALMQEKIDAVAFVSFTHSLLNLARQGLPSNISAMTYIQAQNQFHDHEFVVIDEVQDIPLPALNQIISQAKKVILAGDNFQKIFDRGAEPKVITEIAKNNVHRLTKTYRLTPKAFAAASKIFPGALEGVSSSGKSVVPIELYLTEKHIGGYELSYTLARKQIDLRRTVAILLPTRGAIVEFANFALNRDGKPKWEVTMTDGPFPQEDFGLLNAYLRNHHIKLQIVQNRFGDLNGAFENGEIVLQTYHSAKGLDFEYVFLPNLSVESAGKSHLQKSLFYVAITRASGALIITQVKDFISPFVKLIEEFCDKVDPNRVSLNNEEDEF